MKVALTGTSSTGKTTLAKALLAHPQLSPLLHKRVNVDARKLLRELGHGSIEVMTSTELRDFQRIYYHRKIVLERAEVDYLTERSFVDIAAYWLERDALDRPPHERAELVDRCAAESKRYDLHVYFPLGIVPFEKDSCRSSDMGMRSRVDRRIKGLLHAWDLDHITLDVGGIARRVLLVSAQLLRAAQRPSPQEEPGHAT